MEKRFLKNSIIFCIGSMFVIVLNYFLTAVLARLFDKAAFGEINVLISIFTYLLAIGMSISVAMTYFASEKKKNEKEVIKLYFYLERFFLYVGILIFIIFFVFDGFLQNFFNLNKPFIFGFLGSTFIFGFLLPLSRGFLRGKREFPFVTWNSNLEAIVKILIFFVFYIFKMAFYGFMIALLLSIIFSYWRNRRRIIKKYFSLYNFSIKSNLKISSNYKKSFWHYVPLVFISTLLITSFYTVDVMLIQHFNPVLTSSYVIIAKMAQILFLITHTLVMVLFPEIKSRNTSGKTLYTFLLICFLSIAAFIGYSIFGRFGISILFGRNFVHVVPYLSYSVLIGFFLSIINLTVYYSLGKKESKYIYGLIAGLFLMIINVSLFNSSLNTVLQSITLSIGITSGILYMIVFYKPNKHEALIEIPKNNTLNSASDFVED
jgi:O-antigen/teichoic acid export membrane protein